ncbi:hypothetical protein [Acidovorax sp. FG27]|uniref:hypothetical protein n=1 Tax=Acidovorax sp. FG27 TaxID=3133652 RepID=UPI0030E9926A
MTTTLLEPQINKDALRHVVEATAPSPSAELGVSEKVIDAVANLRNVFDGQLVTTLRTDAQFLLSVSLPPFDPGAHYPADVLTQIQAAAVELQSRVQAKTSGLQELAAGAVHPAVRPLLVTVMDGFRGVFDHAEAIRWAAMNAEAEAELAAGLGHSFGNVEAALKFLARQRK